MGNVNADNVTAFEQDESLYNALVGSEPTVGEKQGASGEMEMDGQGLDAALVSLCLCI
tara:strand:- start:335 stop:508 length:174 start_codon:yes stop_codon:yes gene_type:complete